MSHFVVLVIVKSPTDIEDQVDELLAPFSEHIEVDEYQRDCYCLGMQADRETYDLVTLQLGDINETRASFYAREDIKQMQTSDDWDSIEKEWQIVIEPRITMHNKLLAEHPMYLKPSAACEGCQGVGSRASTYNPKSKWDWYIIGGRWDQYFKLGDADSTTTLNPYVHSEDGNVNYVYDILKQDKVPFAIVTPDGEWHEKGQMGWFATVSNEDKDWPTRAKNILADHQDHYAVTVDCHI